MNTLKLMNAAMLAGSVGAMDVGIPAPQPPPASLRRAVRSSDLPRATGEAQIITRVPPASPPQTAVERAIPKNASIPEKYNVGDAVVYKDNGINYQVVKSGDNDMYTVMCLRNPILRFSCLAENLKRPSVGPELVFNTGDESTVIVNCLPTEALSSGKPVDFSSTSVMVKMDSFLEKLENPALQARIGELRMKNHCSLNQVLVDLAFWPFALSRRWILEKRGESKPKKVEEDGKGSGCQAWKWLGYLKWLAGLAAMCLAAYLIGTAPDPIVNDAGHSHRTLHDGKKCIDSLEILGIPIAFLVFTFFMAKHLGGELSRCAKAGESGDFSAVPRIGTVVVGAVGNMGKLVRIVFGFAWNNVIVKKFDNKGNLGGFNNFLASFVLSEILLLIVLYWNNLIILARSGCDYNISTFGSMTRHNSAIVLDVTLKCLASFLGTMLYTAAMASWPRCRSFASRIGRLSATSVGLFWVSTHIPVDLVQQGLTFQTANYANAWGEVLISESFEAKEYPDLFLPKIFQRYFRDSRIARNAKNNSEKINDAKSPGSFVQKAFISLEIYIADVCYVRPLLREEATEGQRKGAIMVLARAAKIRPALSKYEANCLVCFGWFGLVVYLVGGYGLTGFKIYKFVKSRLRPTTENSLLLSPDSPKHH